MGENTDGSSRAARGAPENEGDQGQGALTLLSRWFGRDSETEGQTHELAGTSRETHRMLLNVRNMADVRIDDVAVPRADIVAVPDTASLDEVVAVFRESTYTRLPVYSETLDSPLGLVHLKDVALNFGFNGDSDEFDLNSILRPLIYVPPSMPMGVLLQKMQAERTHMALVIDEYGGVDGLVTIEDLVEQIVGEIADEHDAEEDDHWVEEKPGVYLCSARAPLEEFEKIAGVDLLPDAADEDVDTMGGLIFMLAGRVPLRGELIPHPDGHEFEVVEADPRMVKRVRVRLHPSVLMDRAAE